MPRPRPRPWGPSAPRSVSLSEVDTVGTAHPFELTAELATRGLGSGATPELAVQLRSTADRALYLAYDTRWPAGGLLPDRDYVPASLRILSTEEAADFTVEHGACPTTRCRPGDDELGGHLVEPSERVSGRFVVVGVAGSIEGSCPPAGRYRVESPYRHATASPVEASGFDAAEKRRFRGGGVHPGRPRANLVGEGPRSEARSSGSTSGFSQSGTARPEVRRGGAPGGAGGIVVDSPALKPTGDGQWS